MLQDRSFPWKVICVTDGNADGQGKIRTKQLSDALEKMGVSDFEQWDLPDTYEDRLDIELICSKLSKLEMPLKVYTHGVLGEYGHPHHQDVSYAVNKFYHNRCEVFNISYNCYPDQVIELTQDEFNQKAHILSQIYGSEINRFAHLVPGTFSEGFAKVEFAEIEHIYQHFTQSSKVVANQLKKYSWLIDHLNYFTGTDHRRIF